MSTIRRILTYILGQEDGSPKRPPLDDEELKIVAYLVDIGESIDKGEYQVVLEEQLSHFEDDSKDLSWTPEDEEYHNMKVYPDVIRCPGSPNMIQFERGDLIELEKVEEAVAYFGSKAGFNNNGSRIRPSLKSMNAKFRFIKNVHHLQKLREYEVFGSAKADRRSNLEFIAIELEKEVKKQIEQGKILHDAVLRFLIAGIIKEHKISIENFIGSDSWLLGWKRRFGVSSRKITKFVSHVRHKTRQQIEKDSQDFVNMTNQILPQYLPSSVFNADQSGFQLEMTTGRTLTLTGSKHVHCVVQSVSSTTHSYTVLPLIASDGTLHPKLFVTLKEKNGRFPKKGHKKCSNLVVTCHSSHIMTKELMKEFFRKVVFDPSMPKDALLIVDGWSSWNDRTAIDSVTPPSNKLKVLQIPAGCTGHIQPCDVGIFGGIKKVVKTLTNYGQISNPEYRMQARDETLKMLSLVWRQLCSPKLKDWVKYAWHAAGYDIPRPSNFKTPAEHLFPRDVASTECSATGCSKVSCAQCLYCEQRFCFKDFLIKDHKC
ncbi:hypothetical protein CRE_17956 [Caenorhabditis remanei]|uniref:HTH CENPB-type domain-containing protein n=1 Tax=Caenorhabditis remanei TaxID=31234 RepID=E3MDR6_CAERE|nr:hypothetical protein CRE_17956 [Caenorhabditis remanei]